MNTTDILINKIDKALHIAEECAMFDGDHHKMWVIDQMVRALTGDSYEAWIEAYQECDEDGDPRYSWDEGIAP